MKNLQKKIDQSLKKYFLSFSKKNLKELNNMFADNIILKDWNFYVKGKKKVLEINKNIFKNKVLKVQLHEAYYNYTEMAVSCKIQVKINKKKLNVVDIIYFNKNMKIKKIIAYLGGK
tara:strand:- start:4510 stop:4860 length:351 start_codon:yes stop_codon:yes gene_type:complete